MTRADLGQQLAAQTPGLTRAQVEDLVNHKVKQGVAALVEELVQDRLEGLVTSRVETLLNTATSNFLTTMKGKPDHFQERNCLFGNFLEVCMSITCDVT